MATKKVFVSGKRYTDEFNIEAVRQVTDRGHPAASTFSTCGAANPTRIDRGKHAAGCRLPRIQSNRQLS
jgi:transposase